ncbi:MAG: GMC family oxidoreductase [Myxococcota bacterium]
MSRPTLAPGVVEGQTLRGDLEIDADVAVIGSGAGGAVAAAVLAKSGLRVVILEEGGYFTSNRFRMLEDEAFGNLYQESGMRTTEDLSVAIFQGRAVGGTTVINWTTSIRAPGEVIEHWRDDFGAANLSPRDLIPHYEAVEERLSIREIPMDRLNSSNRALFDGCRALGYQVRRLSRNVKDCDYNGYCGYGCPVDAKQSMHLTYLPDAMNHGATLISRARVDRLQHRRGKVVAAEATLLDAFGTSPTGATLKLRAKRFLLAAGAIGTPAILLRSGAPDPHLVTGARTMLHPTVAQLGEMPEPADGFQGAPQGVGSHEFADRGDQVGFFIECTPMQPMLMATAIPSFGAPHRAAMERFRHLVPFIGLTIDGRHADVPGGRVRVMESGAPVLDYRVADRTWEAIRDAQKTMARLQLAAGALRSLTSHQAPIVIEKEADLAKLDAADFGPSRLGVITAHVMGGAAVSDDPRRGVVRSEDFRHHQLSNLHVVDGSIFPSGPGVNPQELIFALAHLVATRCAEAWA